MNYENMSDLEIAARVLYARKIPHKIEHKTCFIDRGYEDGACVYTAFDPCSNPRDAFPIIFENRISIAVSVGGKWKAYGWPKWFDKNGAPPKIEVTHENPLIAAMIVFLMMKDAEK